MRERIVIFKKAEECHLPVIPTLTTRYDYGKNKKKQEKAYFPVT